MGNYFTGVGKYIPTETISNLYFKDHQFLDEAGLHLTSDNATIASKLKQITGIEERRYAREDRKSVV